MSDEEINQLQSQEPLPEFHTIDAIARLLGYGLDEPDFEPDDARISVNPAQEEEQDEQD